MDALSLALLVSKMTVLLVVAVVVAAGLRRAPAEARHQVWLATLAGLLVLPGLLALAPVRLAVLPHGFGLSSTSETTPTGTPAAVQKAARDPEASPAVAAPAPPVRAALTRADAVPAFAWPPLGHTFAAVWAAVALALMGWLFAGRLAVRRIVRSARPLEGAHWHAMTCELADRVGLDELPAVLASDRIDMPFATGLWRSTIVLPAAAAAWTAERARVVLLHELGHVRRRDLLGHTVGRLACAVYWFHPLVWTAARRLRDESERACDDLVLDCGARASDYAGHLLDIVAAARRGGTPAVALPMARRREFEGRVLAILDPERARRTPGRFQSAAVLGGLGLLFFSVAASAPSEPAASAAPPRMASASGDEPTVVPMPRPMPMPVPALAAVNPRPGAQRAQSTQPVIAPERRARAAPAGARDPDSRALLVRVLRTDTDAEVRKSAAWALADATEPDAVQALVAALRTDADGEVRETAAWALSDVRLDEVSAALGEALRKDPSAEVRATAAWALGQRRGSDTAALLAAIADRNSEVREAALWALGQQGLEKAPAELTAALGDRDASVRLVAAWALGEIQDPATAPAVKAAFTKETDDEARRALFRAVVFLGDRSRETLEHALTAKDPELRAHAVRLLGGGGPDAWPWPWPWPQPRPNP